MSKNFTLRATLITFLFGLFNFCLLLNPSAKAQEEIPENDGGPTQAKEVEIPVAAKKPADAHDEGKDRQIPADILCRPKKEVEQWRADQLSKMWNETVRFLSREEQLQWLKKEYNQFDSMKHFNRHTPHSFRALVKVVENGQEGLLSKIMMIREAKDSIDLAQMIFDSDLSGYFIVHELREALKRGVSIRIVIDPSFSLPTLQKTIKYLLTVPPGEVKNEKGEVVMVDNGHGKLEPKKATISAVVFNPWMNSTGKADATIRRFKNLFRDKVHRFDTNIGGDGFNRRLHDKLLAVDLASPERARVIIGGRAIQDSFNGISDKEYKPDEWTDMEIIVKNDPKGKKGSTNLLTEVQTYFDKLFFHLANSKLTPSRSDPALSYHSYSEIAQKIFKGEKKILHDRPDLAERFEKMAKEDYLNSGFHRAPVRFLNEIQNMHKKSAYDVYPEEDKKNRINGASIMRQISKEIKKAQKTIDIHTPYLYLTPKEITWLKDWLKADPERQLRIVSNSVFTSDGGPPEALTHHIFGPAFMKDKDYESIQGRVKIYEFGRIDDIRLGGQRKVGRLHGKFVIVDKKVALVTTHNSAPRSRHLNSENGFMIYSKKVSGELTAAMDRSIENCHLWGSDEWKQIRRHDNVFWQRLIQKVSYPFLEKFGLIGLL